MAAVLLERCRQRRRNGRAAGVVIFYPIFSIGWEKSDDF
jgi:hypothetical protein